MRTKALILASVLGVAMVASSVAQVYSVNAVGYINLTLKPGFTMIANQLDNMAGNKISAVLATVPDGTVLYKFNGAGYDIISFEIDQWNAPDTTLAPGEGAFIKVPGTANVVVTLVGDVPQGTLTVNVPAGFWIMSSKVPQLIDMNATGAASVGFPAADGDILYRWNGASYEIFSFEIDQWNGTLQIPVGEAFFYKRVGPATTWTRTFTVS